MWASDLIASADRSQLASCETRRDLHCRGTEFPGPCKSTASKLQAGKLIYYQRVPFPCVIEDEFAHGIIADIATLKATTGRTLQLCSDPSSLLSAIRQAQDQLRAWYERLPYQRQLLMLGADVQLSLKIPIFYVHLLHLGAVILIFRYCLAGFRSSKDRQSFSHEHHDLVDEALSDGLLAAQQSARIVCLMHQASASLRNCSVTMCAER